MQKEIWTIYQGLHFYSFWVDFSIQSMLFLVHYAQDLGEDLSGNAWIYMPTYKQDNIRKNCMNDKRVQHHFHKTNLVATSWSAK